MTLLQPEDDGLAMRPAGKWAIEKLDYLARYIDLFQRGMRNKWPYRNYIDLMAGPGKNRIKGSTRVLLGSPLLALTTGVPFNQYFFVDTKRKNVDALRRRCDASMYTRRVWIESGDCNAIVDSVVEKIRRDDSQSLNLAFLDPEGFEMHWATVAKLASLKRMDLIINFPQLGLKRLMGPVIANEEWPIIDLFFGSKEWREIYGAYQKGELRKIMLVRRIIDHYRDNLEQLGYPEIQQGHDLFGTEPVMRNGQSAQLYRLLFASKHDRGNDFWAKITRRNAHGQGSFFNSPV
jgi:three-Cys-motif partner protein